MGMGHDGENFPGIKKLLPFCLDLAGLLGDSWSGEPPRVYVTHLMQRNVLPHCFAKFQGLCQPAEKPLQLSREAKHL